MKILIVNAGSSSLKYQLVDMDGEKLMAKGLVERIGIEGSKLTQKVNGQEIVFEQPIKDHTEACSLMIKALTDPEKGAVKHMDEIGAVGPLRAPRRRGVHRQRAYQRGGQGRHPRQYPAGPAA